MRQLYGDLRGSELNSLPWPEAAKQTFLDHQFSLQHRHYIRYYVPGDFLLIAHEGAPIGRLYLHHGTPDFLLVDIALSPQWRNRGMGTLLIQAAQDAAAQASARGLALHVEQRNTAARRLYDRLGFMLAGESDGQRFEMHWPCRAELTSALS